MRWSATEGITRCGSLLTGKGFIAHGPQTGRALGFWGIGFSVFLPPVMEYGFIGYALFTSCTAEKIEHWPPNNPPVISDEKPVDRARDISLSLSELSFRIEDADGDRMSYDVTTEPGIGSGSDENKEDGFYSVSVSDLEPDKIYRWTVEVSDGKDTTVERFGFFTEAGPPFDPFDEGWQYRKKITINHTKVTGDLTNFPVLISTVDTDLRDKAQDDGDDILFMNGPSVANRLYHEIERYDGSSGKLVSWVNVTDVASNQDTVLYMYYGNPNSSSQQLYEKTWDNHYLAVYHMHDSDSGISDSTFNNKDSYSTKGDPTFRQTGKAGYTIDFDGTQDVFKIPGGFGLVSNDFTIECWAYADDIPTCGVNTVYALKEDANVHLQPCHVKENESRVLYCHGDHIHHELEHFGDGGGMSSADTWYYYSFTYDNGGVGGTARLNSTEVDWDSSYNGNLQSKNDDSTIGSKITWTGDIEKEWDGYIDEVRISNIVRSDAWLAASYHSQNDPSSFLRFRPEETGA